MRKRAWACILLIFSVNVLASSCKQQYYSHKLTNRVERTLEVIFKRGQVCYGMPEEGDDKSMFVFTSAGQPVFDEQGQSISHTEIMPGTIVNVKYDGYELETYPKQFSGIEEIHVNGYHSNNVDFLFTQINGMFPSTKPNDNTRWEIRFEGEDFLNVAEKTALEYFLKENWTGASVTVMPKDTPVAGFGRITIHFSEATEKTLSMEITIDNGQEGSKPSTKATHATLQGCTWMTV